MRLTLGIVSVAALALAGCGSSTTKTITVPSPSTSTSSSAATAGFTTITSPPSTTAGSSTTSTAQTATSTIPATTTSAAPTATVRLATFRSPSANIGCDIADGVARCDIRRRSWSPPRHPASCPSEVDFGQGLQVRASGRGGFVCAGDTALDPSAPALAYGADSQVGSFTCASRTNGMTCTNAKGHGFFITSEFYRLF
jgi:hypothetical protein